jgi:NDP-sugar pyrophosphorylase family protein
VKAVVLVGGEGTRLRPLTYTTPKSLLPIANVAFLERQLTWLAQHGVTEVVLSLGYLPDAFREHFPEGRFGDVVIRYAVEDKPLGTAGGIRYAAEGIEETFVVCNGDILTDLDLSAVVRFHAQSDAEATIALTRVHDPTAFGVVPTRPDGSVIAFVEKPPPGTAPTDWINAGTYVLEPSLLRDIPPRLSVSIERETFPRMLEQGGRLFAVRSDAYWIDIGTPEKYLEAHHDLLLGRLGDRPAPGADEIAPGVWAVGDVDIDRDAHLEAPVLLGEGSRVDAGAVVADSALGSGVVVEDRARIEHSVLHRGAHVSPGAVITESVLGVDVLVKPESVVADVSLVGAGATIAGSTLVSGGRIAPAAH